MIQANDTLSLFGGKPVRELPWPPHTILGDEERREVQQVLDSSILSGFVAKAGDHFLGGPKVRLLEDEFQRYFDIPFAVSVNSATAGLHAALIALGCRSGDEVVVTPYTMSASATAVLMCNAVPVFVDVDPVYGNIDPEKVERAITPRTRAMVVVHLFGHPAPMQQLQAIAKAHNLPIVEDCAQAPAALYQSKFVGTVGDIGVFSFNQFKTISCGEGGMAVTADAALAERMRLVRNHGECIVTPDGGSENPDIIGFNYRLTELSAAVAVAQFRKLDRLTEHRIALAEYLTKQLQGFHGLQLPQAADRCRHVYFLYPIRFDEAAWGISRDQFVAAMVAEGFPFGSGYAKPLHLLPIYQQRAAEAFHPPFYEGAIDYAAGSMPVAERLFSHEIATTLLCRYPLETSDMDGICRAVEKIWRERHRIAAC